MALLHELVALRRSIHSHPEVGLELPRTRAALLAALNPLGLEIVRHNRSSSFSAVVHGDIPGPAVLLRADMDALAIDEDTGLSFASTNGAMHACGHDMHAAALVGAAHLLHANRSTLAGDVILMFQAGEEGHGGARLMIDEGVLDVVGERPVAAYAIHVVPGAAGVFSTRVGALLAGGSALHITVHGVGGHGALPLLARDPVVPAAEIVLALRQMVGRVFDAETPVVATVTQLSASQAITIIPDEVRIGATVRTLSRDATALFGDEARAVATKIALDHGCTATTRLDVTFPVTVNDARETGLARDALAALFGEHRVAWLQEPIMASEDFSHVLDQIPGAMFTFTASPALAHDVPLEWNHSPRVLFDDGLLPDLAAALAHLAFSRLTAHRLQIGIRS